MIDRVNSSVDTGRTNSVLANGGLVLKILSDDGSFVRDVLPANANHSPDRDDLF